MAMPSVFEWIRFTVTILNKIVPWWLLLVCLSFLVLTAIFVYCKRHHDHHCPHCQSLDYEDEKEPQVEDVLNFPAHSYNRKFCELAKQCINNSDYNSAERYAEASIQLNPDNYEAYYFRAEAKLVLSRTTNLIQAIDDYISCFKLTPSKQRNLDEFRYTALSKALILAVDAGKTELLNLSDLVPSQCECNTLLDVLVEMKNCLCKHLDYLVRETESSGSGHALRLSCDLAGFKCCKLFSKRDANISTLQAVMNLGAKIKCSDIKQLDWQRIDKKLLQHLTSMPSICTFFIQRAIECPAIIPMYFSGKFGPPKPAHIDLGELMNGSNWHMHPELVQALVQNGVSPDGTNSKNPLDIVLAQKAQTEKEHKCKLQIISILAKTKPDLKRTSFFKKEGTTIVHVATELTLAIKTGCCNCEDLKSVCDNYKFPDNGRLLDKNCRTPLHIAMHVKYSECAEQVCQVLSNYHIDPNVKDSQGRLASEYKKPSDKRQQILRDVLEKFEKLAPDKSPTTVHKQRKKRNKTKNSSVTSTPCETFKESDTEKMIVPLNLEPKSDPGKSDISKVEVTSEELHSIQHHLEMLSKEKESYFKPQKQKKKMKETQQTTKNSTDPVPVHEHMNQDARTKHNNPQRKSEAEILASKFEGLPWEVEMPKKPIKGLMNAAPNLRKEIFETIYTLAANGIPLNNQNQSKQAKGSKVPIYETRVNDGVRILYQIPIQFSERLTSKQKGSKGGNIYSEVIRIWDIVIHHKKLDERIKKAVEKIKLSCERGKKATTTIPLRMPKQNSTASNTRFPQYYVDDTNNQATAQEIADELFSPAASPKEDEHSLVTFFSCEPYLVKSILEGTNPRRDYPFKGWPKEHEIISMEQGKSSILLLGRSGTGKTTCCLYRLWNQFQTYWSLANESGSKLILRTPLLNGTQDQQAPETKLGNKKDTCCESNSSLCGLQDCTSEDCSSDDCSTKSDRSADHFHQIFITKNYVLCSQMKKQFYNLAAGNDVAKAHELFEDEPLPFSLAAIDDYAYPLFLTARDFFTLLDNSLNDGENFFCRDESGELTHTLLSSDYDHENPETLMDLEYVSDEEDYDEESDEEDASEQPKPKAGKSKKIRREITSSYFAKHIWPHICPDTKTDPLLVWTEIKSFIKGSLEAVESDCGYLSQEEYESLGQKLASTFATNRSEIYQLFLDYQIRKQQIFDVFDECDLVHNIYTRLNKLQDLPWAIHSFYIDEVQDFTQAELAIFLQCCRDPNNLFLTGDSAQSIMRGISFRFSEIQSMFYGASKHAKKFKKGCGIVVPKIIKLDTNFRSHSQVLQLAGSITDLLGHFFPDSFEYLPVEKGMFEGPTPLLLDSTEVTDLALVLRGNKRDTESPIEFGAPQVIIVQSEEAKNSLPDVLKAEIVLTIFEAKGLEFDDVLLYNFFKDSTITKEWRVVSKYLKERPKLINNTETSFDSEPHPLTFDEQQHKSLVAELKNLYTAITRAKCNLWIYDSDEIKRLPMFDYWLKRGLVKVVRVNQIPDGDNSMINTVITGKSAPEKWGKIGEYFKRNRLWEPAMKCFKRAGLCAPENEAKAWYHLQQATRHPSKSKVFHLKAALAFLESDCALHNQKFLRLAAKCLKVARKYTEAGTLYCMLNMNTEAVKQLSMSKDIDETVKLLEKMEHFDAAIMAFVKHDKAIEALELSKRYKAEHVKLREENRVASLAHLFAKQLTRQKNYSLLGKVAKYFPIATDQVHYLKEAKKFDEACKILDENHLYEELYELYNMTGSYSEGLKLAQRVKNDKWQAVFTFQIANAEINEKGCITNSGIVSLLEMYRTSWSCPKDYKARALLLLGRSGKNFALCQVALTTYRSNQGLAGFVEAFNLFTEFKYNLGFEDAKLTIEACDKASKILEVIKQEINNIDNESSSPNYDFSLILSTTESFYDLRKLQIGEKLLYQLSASSQQHIWVHFSASNGTSSEGMITVDRKCCLKDIKQHLQHYLQIWKLNDEFKVSELSLSRLNSTRFAIFHKTLAECNELYLQEQKSLSTIFARNLHSYLDVCFMCYEAKEFGDGRLLSKLDIPKLLLTFISPKVSSYAKITRGHMERIVGPPLCEHMKKTADTILIAEDDRFNMDEWLDAWRIYSIMGRVQTNVMTKLQAREQFVRSHPKMLSDVYIFNYKKREYNHIFTMWILSCQLFQRGKVVPASKIVLRYVLEPIIEKDTIRCTLSRVNLVNILSVHTSALLFLLNRCKLLLRQKPTMIVPLSFMHILRIFENINWQGYNKSVLEASLSGINPMRANIHKLEREIRQTLWHFLDILLGFHDQTFLPLWNSVTTDESVQRGEARECLILTLILFGNLAQTDIDCPDLQLHVYQLTIHKALKRICSNRVDADSDALKKAYNTFGTSVIIAGTFFAVKHLLTSVNQKDYLSVAVPNESFYRKYDLSECTLQDYPQRQLTSPKQLNQRHFMQEVLKVTPDPQAESDMSETLFASQLAGTLQRKQTGTTLNPYAAVFQPRSAATEQFKRMSSNDEEMEEVLRMAGDKKQTSEEPTTAIENTSLMEPTFCRACAVSLNPSKEADTEEGDHAGSVEGYSSHSKSQKHKDNCELYRVFTQECKADYEQHKSKLMEVKQKCQTFTEEHTDSSVLSLELQTAIENEIENGNKIIHETGLNGQWPEGISTIQLVVEKLDSLIDRIEEHIKSEIEKEEQREKERKVEEDREISEEKEIERLLQPKTIRKKRKR